MKSFLGARLQMDKPPADFPNAVKAILEHMVPRLVQEGLPHLVFLTFGKRPMRWELTEVPEGLIDELLIAICHQEQAFCAALVFPCPPPPGVDAPEAIMIRTEDAMQRKEIVVGFKGEGAARAFRIYEGKGVLADAAWVGRETDDVSVHELEDEVGYFGAIVEA